MAFPHINGLVRHPFNLMFDRLGLPLRNRWMTRKHRQHNIPIQRQSPDHSAELLQRVEQHVALLDGLLVSCVLEVWTIRLYDPIDLVDGAVESPCRNEPGQVAVGSW